jgi:hypothetical protein
MYKQRQQIFFGFATEITEIYKFFVDIAIANHHFMAAMR